MKFSIWTLFRIQTAVALILFVSLLEHRATFAWMTIAFFAPFLVWKDYRVESPYRFHAFCIVIAALYGVLFHKEIGWWNIPYYVCGVLAVYGCGIVLWSLRPKKTQPSASPG